MVVVTASAIKQSRAKYGIAFSRKTHASPLMIGTIREESPFARKHLEPGMVVTKVNDKEVLWLGPLDAAKILQKSEDGSKMKVEAATLFSAKVKKKNKKTKCGIWLKNSTKVPGVFVSHINKNGLFAGSALKTGMKLVQINDIPIYDDTGFHECLEMIKKLSGAVEIKAIDTIDREMTNSTGVIWRIAGFACESSGEDCGEDFGSRPFLDRLFPSLVNL